MGPSLMIAPDDACKLKMPLLMTSRLQLHTTIVRLGGLSRSTGKERDSESGLDYFGARYYSFNAGRFLGIDRPNRSLAEPQLWNMYSYVGNAPLAFVDPDGWERKVFGYVVVRRWVPTHQMGEAVPGGRSRTATSSYKASMPIITKGKVVEPGRGGQAGDQFWSAPAASSGYSASTFHAHERLSDTYALSADLYLNFSCKGCVSAFTIEATLTGSLKAAGGLPLPAHMFSNPTPSFVPQFQHLSMNDLDAVEAAISESARAAPTSVEALFSQILVAIHEERVRRQREEEEKGKKGEQAQ